MDKAPVLISVVIATCNRRERLLALLDCLAASDYPLQEVIVVDGSSDRLEAGELQRYTKIAIQYLPSEASVCAQRNAGIRRAVSPWIFLCDDDVSFSPDYLGRLVAAAEQDPQACAFSGLWMELRDGAWGASHPVRSGRELWAKYVFGLGIWGEIRLAQPNAWTKKILRHYQEKGNHLTAAGWPVNTDFSKAVIPCPVYSLGAALVRRESLLRSPFDEVLDRHGIGDHYGVIRGFASPFVYVVTGNPVFHHQSPVNRLEQELRYYRRVLALGYFIRRSANKPARLRWLLWSVLGNGLLAMKSGNFRLARKSFRAILKMSTGRNPYVLAQKNGRRIIEPK